jgi:hypothetical protein
MTVPNIITDNSITVMVSVPDAAGVVRAKTLVAKANGHPNFEAIKAYLKAGAPDVAKLAAMFDVAQAITTRSNGRVTIAGNVVSYDGKPLHNSLTTRMLAMLGEGFDIQPLINFLQKLMQNPSHRAVNGLFDFLAATNIPITPDGDFLAYKKVRNTYFDIHSNTMRNAVGDEPRVPRNAVDEDPDRTCSHGLHVCSESYLAHFGSSGGSDRVMIVQVNPADVVAIPRDYNNAKMRCAGYKVIAEVAPETVRNAFTAAVMSQSNFQPIVEDVDGSSLSSDPTDVIRNIDGLVVRFVFDEDEETWTAEWTDADGDEQETTIYVYDLDEAVEYFTADFTAEVETWTAEVRWLDEDGELIIETAKITDWGADADDGAPDAADFTYEMVNDDDSALDYDSEDSARVVNITKVAGSKKRVFI